MSDPFQSLAKASPEFIDQVVKLLEDRARDPAMLPIIEAYLDEIDWPEVASVVEVGSGTGAVSRMIAARAPQARVLGVEPSPQLVEHARTLAAGTDNLSFEAGDGAKLALKDASIDLVVMHTVLSHVAEPDAIVADGARVLAMGGTLVICDADFSKASLANAAGDPLQGCAEHFIRNFVSEAHLTGRLRSLVSAHGLDTFRYRVTSRLVSETAQMAVWVKMSGDQMVERGVIGRPLADALLAEHDRRLAEGSLYGFLPFVTLMARKRT